MLSAALCGAPIAAKALTLRPGEMRTLKAGDAIPMARGTNARFVKDRGVSCIEITSAGAGYTEPPMVQFFSAGTSSLDFSAGTSMWGEVRGDRQAVSCPGCGAGGRKGHDCNWCGRPL